jgi:CHASE2 domain-containing sensor protein
MIRRLISRLNEKPFRYWVTASIVFILTITGSSKVYEYLHLTNARSYYFQQLLEWGPRVPNPKFVTLVLVEDQEYWQGYPAGRRPIKRDYLASIVDTLVTANANVIALDFDTRLPDPNSTKIPTDYKRETDILIQAIENAARKGKKVVLPTSIWRDAEGRFHHDSDIYQSYGYCKTGSQTDLIGQVANQVETPKKNISCGYIELPDNPLIVPLRQMLGDGSYLDSFALAVARAVRPDLISDFLERIGPGAHYSNYIAEEKFAKSKFSARRVLEPGADNDALQASAVIVGGHWRSLALGRGLYIDSHPTPIGSIVGAELHANYVEDLLDTRSYGTFPFWFLRATEIIFSLIAAIAFAVILSFWGKVVGILALFVLLLFVQWVVLHGFGVFFDAFVPLLGLALHTLYERLFGPHEAALAL